MFDKMIAYSIKHKFIIGLMVMALIGVGTYSLQKLPIDALPDITNNQVQIITTTPNLATQEVELFITYPIELAIKSIPEIVELRSVSRFGLSLVTVVFKEDVDIYWARNQITERLKRAENEIPEGYGTPELAPVSTGLGEIYQYTVGPAAGYEDQYDAMELRSIQDWIIVPQLLGTKGIAEVNTLGGLLKEYEVAVNPDKLKSMNVTMAEIFDALRLNNENTGGAYIDKKPNAYFIRSLGMASSLDDIGKIVVKTENNIPILIRDVAEARYGHAVRYGASTKDGQGEVVHGMVMMLKGENSAEIVSLVKDKMAQIEKTLPSGIMVNPYLERSKLVDRAISTVRTNLIEGALIVIFILVLLIGNWRAGLIVATVIPLALLFAVTMMRLFGVSGNLMSLGAIDFGLIVDGAVIIVEAIVHRLQSNPVTKKLSAQEMDQEVYAASSKIRSSAAFGEIIILIVYLPILALVGIEGKMFRPMAQTVSFAILGAFILSLTYVPMMSALFLNKTTGYKKTISDRIIGFFQRLYTPVLNWSLKLKPIILSIAVALFVIAFLVFRSLGGEFIPTLSEGDIATHIIIPPGSSLEQEIATTSKAERILLDRFPEIDQIVSKIGSAEVPTDPMPMEVADMLVIMKDKSEWVTAHSKNEMLEKMEKALDDLPGVTTEFSQPIQMRFNELMTGIRSDVGVKIFGDDIDRLVSMGDEAVSIIQQVAGVQDARAEAVSGLSQITVKYNKDKLALYGLNVGDLNHTLSMGFAGDKAGSIYDGEEKYDLVVRLAEPFRQDISNIRDLYITLPSGSQIPLDQVADVRFEQGPAQISRENGKRRIIIGFNVRDRDVESVVREIQSKFDQQLKLPVGYYVAYAGQFENLQRASKRLSIAVPIALVLIFILLFFTFNSIKQSFLIFTAIPLSAIGGVFALWLRDMPFSISAGVGFIALFGVAVLNGIVLIAYFNQLKEEGMTDIVDRIKEGTRVRLRPVIMTASVASLGFLPMALSSSAGAEVQKPLATVVIGGLITATLLTLIVLPILYYYSEKGVRGIKNKLNVFIYIIILSAFSTTIDAQVPAIATLDEAILIGFQSNMDQHISKLEIGKYERLKEGAYLMPKMDVGASLGQLNSRSFDQSYSVTQSFSPYLSRAKKKLAGQYVMKARWESALMGRSLKYTISSVWDAMDYHEANIALLKEQQIIWRQFKEYARLKFDVGESAILETTTADVKYAQFEQQLKEQGVKKHNYQLQLQLLLNSEVKIIKPFKQYQPLIWKPKVDSVQSNVLVGVILAEQEVEIAKALKAVSIAEKKPDFTLGYFIQSIRGEQNVNDEAVQYNAVPRFQGVQLGMRIPVFGKGYKWRTEAAQADVQILEARANQLERELKNEINGAVRNYEVLSDNLQYYTDSALPNAALISSNAQLAYKNGDISYLELVQALNTQFEIRKSHLAAIQSYNQTVNFLKYLLNK